MWLIELTHWIHRRAAETAATRIGKEITRLSVTTIPALSARFGVEGENAVAGLRSLRRARSRGSDYREVRADHRDRNCSPQSAMACYGILFDSSKVLDRKSFQQVSSRTENRVTLPCAVRHDLSFIAASFAGRGEPKTRFARSYIGLIATYCHTLRLRTNLVRNIQ
jgi:hypothetical protein